MLNLYNTNQKSGFLTQLMSTWCSKNCKFLSENSVINHSAPYAFSTHGYFS